MPTPQIKTPPPLGPRLVTFGSDVCLWTRRLRPDPATEHIVRQLIRSATAPGAHHAEGRAAESRRDFTHKLRLALKELRETAAWLQTAAQLGHEDLELRRLAKECNELTAIVVASVRTAGNVERRERPERLER